MNEVSLVGRMTKDPLLRQLSNGRVQSTFVLAVNRTFKNQAGNIETDFILCTIWGKLAENTVKYCGKGSLVALAGRIQSRSYEREDKSRVYVTEIIGEKVHFISTKARTTTDVYNNPKEVPITSVRSDEEHFQVSEQLPIT